jgi:hypothetical protein
VEAVVTWTPVELLEPVVPETPEVPVVLRPVVELELELCVPLVLLLVVM